MWEFLSYELSNTLSGYGNGERIKVNRVRSMCCGDTSNNSTINVPVHFGTHLDYPFHFSSRGKNSSDYKCSDFIFNNIKLLEIDLSLKDCPLIDCDDIHNLEPCSKSEVLIIKTGFCHKRPDDEYWSNGPGFDTGVALFLKEKLPNLKLVGFDSISLTNYQNRPLGRIVHNEFLIESDLLILEDMDLRSLNKNSQVKSMFVSPLRVAKSDGALVTVFAEVLND